MNRVRYALALAILVATWLLILIGGTVNPTGSSMACPDWYFIPTCNGELLPTMEGGVLFEHGHREWAAWVVGMATTALVVTMFVGPRPRPGLRATAFIALAMVCFQGALGGITVLVGIHPAISTAHLAMAQVFFCYVALACLRIGRAGTAMPGLSRGLIAAAAAGVFAQIVLGGLVRHLGAGLICGDDSSSCGPAAAWMKQPLAHLHMTHRLVGYALIPFVWIAARHASRVAADRPLVRRLALAARALVLVQVGLGLATVASGRSVAIVTFHTGVAALLLVCLWTCVIAMGERREEARRG